VKKPSISRRNEVISRACETGYQNGLRKGARIKQIRIKIEQPLIHAASLIIQKNRGLGTLSFEKKKKNAGAHALQRRA
jgi:hypothetical protein